MGAPYTATSVNGYNANPPPDDGTTTPQNQITWAGIKSKLSDPLNTFAASVDANITTAFGKTLDGASIVSTAIDYPMSSADQGRLIVATASCTITTPDAASVGAPFVFAVNNQSAVSISLAANAAGGQLVDGLTSQVIPSGGGCVVKTDGTNWYTFGLSAASIPPTLPCGYLTLSSDQGNIVITSDTTASTINYLKAYGNACPIWNGAAFQTFTFSTPSLTLNNPSHAANTLYDVFAFSNGGTFTIGTGPAWSNSTAGSCARGTGAGTTQLSKTNGIFTNAFSMTVRNGATTYTVNAQRGTYLGTIFIDSTPGQVTCHVSWGQSRKWGIWNAYNRLPVLLQCGDSTSSWNYTSTTVRAANNSSANSLTVLCGLAEEQIACSYQIFIEALANVANNNATPGVGWNSTTVNSGIIGSVGIVNNSATNDKVRGNGRAEYDAPPSIGINTVTALESISTGGGTVTWNGGQANMLLRARWRG